MNARITRTIIASFAFVLGLAAPLQRAVACGEYASPADVISEEALVARRTIDAMRHAGPSGLALVLETHRQIIAAANEADWRSHDVATQASWDRLRLAIDAVGAAKDNHIAQLYWHTDIELAKQAAKDSSKPILSLRLLGRLDEDLSCANSRFFRTALYANKTISRFLRDNFILHWQSVRPVPHITIDFGDGRVIKRTITGNSIHYVLDSDGRPIDAIPGLYSPAMFSDCLRESLRLTRTLVAAPDDSTRHIMLAQHHAQRAGVIKGRWLSHLQSIGAITPDEAVAAVNLAAFREPNLNVASIDADAIPAMLAAPVALTKAGIERPTLAAMGLDAAALAENTSDDVWQQIAAIYEPHATLDASSIALMRAKTPDALLASQITFAKREEEDPMLRVIANFQQSLALDSVRNEFMLHRQIHDWFAAGEINNVTADQLNSRVYAELFLTPESDPWLGLVPESYAAIDHGGVRCN